MANEKRLHSVTNATRLLVELAGAGGPVRLSDLSERLDMTKSSVHLLLATLVDAGFVEQTAQATYRLGLAVFEVGAAALDQYGLGARLAPPMEALAVSTSEAISLAVVHDGSALLVQRFESDQILRASIRVGTRMPLHTSASGRCLLAYLPDAERRELLEQCGLASPSVLRKLSSRAKAIRADGYESQRDEWAVGVSAIAAPVFGIGDRIVGSVSITWPTSRFDPDPWVRSLLATAEELTRLAQSMALSVRHLIAPPPR